MHDGFVTRPCDACDRCGREVERRRIGLGTPIALGVKGTGEPGPSWHSLTDVFLLGPSRTADGLEYG